MTEVRDDVPLLDAMLLWDDNRGDRPQTTRQPPVVIDQYRTERGVDPATWDNGTGAAFDHWASLSDEGRLIELLRDAWTAVVRDGVDPAAMHTALLTVPEFRAILHPGDLPEHYQRTDPRLVDAD